MRNKSAEVNFGNRPLALGSDTTFDWIETDEYFYLGEW